VQNYFDINAKTVTFNVANGTYGQLNISGPLFGMGGITNFNRTTLPVQFIGNPGSPSSVIISAAAVYGAIQVEYGAAVGFNGFQVTNTVSSGLFAHFNAVVQFSNFVFPSMPTWNHVSSEFGADIIAFGNYTITGGAGCHWITSSLGQIESNGVSNPQVTVSGTPNFTSAFACVQYPGGITIQGPMSFNGAATGVRYQVLNSGGFITGTGSTTFFPGNSAGTTASTQYQ
jgi:hypothetical protein